MKLRASAGAVRLKPMLGFAVRLIVFRLTVLHARPYGVVGNYSVAG
jgi:hypothetical protein